MEQVAVPADEKQQLVSSLSKLHRALMRPSSTASLEEASAPPAVEETVEEAATGTTNPLP